MKRKYKILLTYIVVSWLVLWGEWLGGIMNGEYAFGAGAGLAVGLLVWVFGLGEGERV